MSIVIDFFFLLGEAIYKQSVYIGYVVIVQPQLCYNQGMYTVRITEEFANWYSSLRDSLTRKRLRARLRKAELGNLGDVRHVGEGVWEMREFFGPGWRMYYTLRGALLVVMLHGGDKSAQQADIARAIEIAQNLCEEDLP